MNTFLQNFDERIDYPNAAERRIFPASSFLYNYVGSDVLADLVGMFVPLSAYLITRYSSYTENARAVQTANDVGITQGDPWGFFRDDLLVLAKIPDDVYRFSRNNDATSVYWYFHFDKDSSDCSFGRLHSYGSEDTIIKEFAEHCKDSSLLYSVTYSQNEGLGENKDGRPALEVDIDRIKKAWPNSHLRKVY